MSNSPRNITPAAAAILIAAFLGLFELGSQRLWSDEADTALFARNLLEFGNLTAWNGTNLIAFSGGYDLDDDLVNSYMPPQQYYIAALGLKAFGDSEFGLRFPFALLGIVTVALVSWWARSFFGAAFAWYLPPLLLGLSPAFLLFIRNCRYYAPGLFWTTLLFLAWTLAATSRQAGPAPRGKGTSIAICAVAVVSVAGLFTCHYIYGIAALAVLPFFFLDPRFRTRRQAFLILAVYLAGGLCLVLPLLRGSSAGTLFERRPDLASWFYHWGKLFWWHVRDMGIFEFFAWPMVIALALPWLIPKLESCRPLARRALVLLAVFTGYLAVVSFLSPQTFTGTRFADMRYVLPLLVTGVMLSGAGIFVLAEFRKWIAVVTALVLVFTNVLYVGAHASQKRQLDYLPVRLFRSTLVDFLREQWNPAVSTTEKIRRILEELPDGTRVVLSPAPLATSAMYYLPRLRFCGLLAEKKVIDPELRRTLPDYLLLDSADPEFILLMVSQFKMENGQLEFTLVEPELRDVAGGWIDSGLYQSGTLTRSFGWDETRPDIPMRLFYDPPDESPGSFRIWSITRKSHPVSTLRE